MNGIPIHPLVVHFPVALTILLPVVAGLTLWTIRRGARPLRAWGVTVAVAAALTTSAFVAVRTGEAQEEVVEDVVAEQPLETHEEAGERFLVLSGVLTAIMAVGLVGGLPGVAARMIGTVGALGLVVAGVQVGSSGGELVYRHGAASAYTTGTAGGEAGEGDEAEATDGRRGSSRDGDDDDEDDDDRRSGRASGATAAFGAMILPAIAAAQPATHGSSAANPDVEIPSSIREEHAEIHDALVEATKMKAPVGAAARALAKILHPHFVREEQVALPPLALLAPLAAGRFESRMMEILPLADTLRAELAEMVRQHGPIAEAARELERTARKARQPEIVKLARKLQAHAASEEQVLYPAAVLVGDLVRMRAGDAKP